MEETFYTSAIILKRTVWREHDSKVTVYSLEKGKLELVARGTKKILSKLASHLEPITLSDLMVIKGRQLDYVGTAISEENFKIIKKDLEKIFLVGEIINLFNSLVKEQEKDPQLFYLLRDFLFLVNEDKVDKNKTELLSTAFKIKLIDILGYTPNFENCIVCGQKNISKDYVFDFAKGGIVCQKCEMQFNKSAQKFEHYLIENYKKVFGFNFKDVVNIESEIQEVEELKVFVDGYILANIK